MIQANILVGGVFRGVLRLRVLPRIGEGFHLTDEGAEVFRVHDIVHHVSGKWTLGEMAGEPVHTATIWLKAG